MSRLLCWFVLLPAAAFAAEPPPNVVLVFADDLGHGDLGCYGNKVIRTPHIDSLARDGVLCTDFYAAQAVCSASRAALLTGCYPNRIGIHGALAPSARHGLHDRETTIAEMLKARGYATAIYGKWHLGHHPPFLPTRHGFDDYYGLPYSNDMWPKHPTSKFPSLPLIEGDKTIETDPDQRKLTTEYTERGVRFIAANKDRPFFLYLPHAMPHVPLHVSDKHAGRSKAGAYGDVIEELDWSVGEILKTLKQLDLERRTIVIFTSDNGPWLSYGDHAGTTGGLREGKGTSWEGGVRVPFVVRWPGKLPAGEVRKDPAMTIDVLPTVAKWTGSKLPELKIDGQDVGGWLVGEKGATTQEAYFAFWGTDLQAVRSGKWKLHFPHEYRSLKTAGSGGRPGVYATGKTEMALYDLENDRAEKMDVSAAHPDVVTRLEGLARPIRQDLGDLTTKGMGPGARPAAILQAPK